MITCVCMNPCIDRTAACGSFDTASANRITPVREDIGGKGINAAIAVRNLEGDAAAVVLAPDESRARLVSFLEANRIHAHTLSVPGRLRVNLKIRTASGQTVEINEEGAPTDAAVTAEAEEAILSLAAQSAVTLLTGSLPPGVPASFYAGLAHRLHRQGCRCAVDADDEALRLALRERPALIKPNRQEFARLTGETPSSPNEAGRMAARLRAESGCSAVCLSLGGDGAVLVSENGCFFAPAISVPVRSLHGAGDSMLAALCLKAETLGLGAEALRFASAAAAATVMKEGTEMCTLEDTLRLLPKAVCISLES